MIQGNLSLLCKLVHGSLRRALLYEPIEMIYSSYEMQKEYESRLKYLSPIIQFSLLFIPIIGNWMSIGQLGILIRKLSTNLLKPAISLLTPKANGVLQSILCYMLLLNIFMKNKSSLLVSIRVTVLYETIWKFWVLQLPR